jgi:hypothetical protein
MDLSFSHASQLSMFTSKSVICRASGLRFALQSRNQGVAQYIPDACAMKSGGIWVLRSSVSGSAQRIMPFLEYCAVGHGPQRRFGYLSGALLAVFVILTSLKQQTIHFGCATLVAPCPLYTPESSVTRQCSSGNRCFPTFGSCFCPEYSRLISKYFHGVSQKRKQCLRGV